MIPNIKQKIKNKKEKKYSKYNNSFSKYYFFNINKIFIFKIINKYWNREI